MAKAAPITRLTLFMPGTAVDEAAWKKAFEREGGSWRAGRVKVKSSKLSAGVECIANDGAFGEAFMFGTVKKKELKEIAAAPTALVLSLECELHAEPVALIELVRALQRCGALAVRIEESKLGFAIGDWLDLMEAGDFFRCAVVVLDEADASRTCGMHVFSLPDAQLDGSDAAERSRVLTSLCRYQIDEAGVAHRPHVSSGSRDAEACAPALAGRWVSTRAYLQQPVRRLAAVAP